jgi:hypothetical protein
MDATLYHHFNGLRSNLAQPSGLPSQWANGAVNQVERATHNVELSLYARRRGIDLMPRVGAPPQVGDTNISSEPLPVFQLPYRPVDVGPDRFAMPCDDEVCAAPLTAEPDGVSSLKYWMPTAGPDAGIVFARNLLPELPEVVNVAATEVTAAAADLNCGGDPCFVAGSMLVQASAGQVTMDPSSSMSMFIANDSVPAQGAGAGPFASDKYDEFLGPNSVRPGRTYALHAALSINCADCVMKLMVRSIGTARVSTEVLLSNDHTSDTLSFTFRAPLQWSEHLASDLFDRQGGWGASPGLEFSVATVSGVGTEVTLDDLTLVELDGLSSGWMMKQDAWGAVIPDEPAAAGEEAGVEVWGVVGPAPGPCTSPRCVSYAMTTPTGASYASVFPVVNRPRFSARSGVWLAADYLSEVLLPAGPGPFHVSGVLRPGLGLFRPSAAEGYASLTLNGGATVAAVRSTEQPVDLFSPGVWATPSRSLVGTIRALDIAHSVLGGYRQRDFLWGPSGSNYQWFNTEKVLSTTVASEVHQMNLGFSGWRDEVYEPLSHHEVLRATFCNIANVVNAPWSDGNGGPPAPVWRGWCDFAAPGEACDSSLAALSGSAPCDLLTTLGDVKVGIDSNMHRDATTANGWMEFALEAGALSATSTYGPYSASDPWAPSGATVSNTLAANVEHQMWGTGRDWQGVLEGACDVTDIPEFRHPGLASTFTLSPQDQNACMMAGRAGNGRRLSYMSFATHSDTARNQTGSLDGNQQVSSLAAGLPTLFSSVEASVQADDVGGSDLATLSYPFLGYAATCFWNPGWSFLGAVSVDLATPSLLSPGPSSPWCASGTAWVDGVSYTTAGYESLTDSNAIYRLACLDFGFNIEQEWNSCVRASEPGPLWMGMRPQVDALVPLGPDLEGKEVRAVMGVGYLQAQDSMDQALSCKVAKALSGQAVTLPTPMVLDDVMRGRLFFLNAAGDLLNGPGEDVTTSPDCSTQNLSLFNDADASVEVVPLLERRTELVSVATVRVRGVVPPGAAYVGVVVRAPGDTLGRALSQPVASTVTFEVATDAAPAFLPAWSRAAHNAQNVADRTVGAWVTSPPHTCDDVGWFAAMALMETDCLKTFDVGGGAP